MNNISKLGEDIEKRLQTIESTQEESNKIIIELNNKINTLEDHVRNTHQTFNLLLENINSKNERISPSGKFIESSDSSDTDSDSSSEQKKRQKQKQKQKQNKKQGTRQMNRNRRGII